MVHVLLSIDKPVGRFGDAEQEVAPVTLVMPPPEPLLSPVEESQVLLPETATGVFELVVPPSPKLPDPQHFMSPLSRMAQVCAVPDIVEVSTATAVRPVPRSIAPFCQW